MASPFRVRDLGQVLGSWPFIPDSSGTSVVQAPSSVDARATILGLVREPASGYAVGSKNFNLWVDVAGTPTSTQINFSAGNKTLAEVITTINTALGSIVASNDNGFLRLTSPTVGADSYLRLESILGSEDVFSELGLFSETIARGGDITQAQHIDPSRGVAGSKQYSVAVGESLEAATVNRGLLQIGFNAGAAENRTSIGARTRKVREAVTASGEIGLQLGTTDPTRRIYVGTTVTPSNAELKNLVRVLDSDGNELVRNVFFPTGETISGVDVQSNIVDVPRQYATVQLNGGTFASGITEGDFIQFLNPANGLEAEPRRVVQTTGTTYIIIETGGIVGGTVTGVNIEKYEGYGSVKVQVEGIYDTFSAPATFGSRVEGTAVAVPASSGSVTLVERGNRVVVSDPAVDFTNANVGDLVTWTSAGSSNPWSNNGEYRIKAIIDANTIEVVNVDYTPAILNPDDTGGLGDIAVTTDGAFSATPFIRLTPQTEVNAGNGVGLVPINGENIVFEYYVEETYADALNNDPNAQGPVSSSVDADVQNLIARFDKMHDEFGNGTDMFTNTLHVMNAEGDQGPLTVVGNARWLAEINFENYNDRVRTRVSAGEMTIGEFAGYSLRDFWDQFDDNIIEVSGGFTRDRAGLVIGYPATSDISSSDQSIPTSATARLTVSGDGARAASTYVGASNIGNLPATLSLGFRRESEALASEHTFWGLSAVGDGTDAILKLSLLGLYEDVPTSQANSIDNQMVFHSSGAVGINLGGLVAGSGKLGVPDRNLHIRGRSDVDAELLRLEGFSGTADEIGIGFKRDVATNQDTTQGFISLRDNSSTGSHDMIFGIKDVFDPDARFVFKKDADFGGTGVELLSIDDDALSNAVVEIFGSNAELIMSGNTASIELSGANSEFKIDGTITTATPFTTLEIEPTVRLTTLESARDITSNNEAETEFFRDGFSVETTDPKRILHASFRGFEDTGGGIYSGIDIVAHKIYVARAFDVGSIAPYSGVEIVTNAIWDDDTDDWSHEDPNRDSNMFRFNVGESNNLDTPVFEILHRNHNPSSADWNDTDDPAFLGGFGWTRIFSIPSRPINAQFFESSRGYYDTSDWVMTPVSDDNPESSVSPPYLFGSALAGASPVWIPLNLPDGAVISEASATYSLSAYSSGEIRFTIVRVSNEDTDDNSSIRALKTSTPYSLGSVATGIQHHEDMLLNESISVRRVDNTVYRYFGWFSNSNASNLSVRFAGFEVRWVF